MYRSKQFEALPIRMLTVLHMRNLDTAGFWAGSCVGHLCHVYNISAAAEGKLVIFRNVSGHVN